MKMDPVSKEEIERAVESAAHQIAAGVHAMLAELHVTVAELKAALMTLPKFDDELLTVLDDLLVARNPHRITVHFLADIAFLMGFEWKFNIRRIERLGPMTAQPESQTTLSRDPEVAEPKEIP